MSKFMMLINGLKQRTMDIKARDLRAGDIVNGLHVVRTKKQPNIITVWYFGIYKSPFQYPPNHVLTITRNEQDGR